MCGAIPWGERAWQSGRGLRDLVFVHGLQNDHNAWRPLMERLDKDRYRYTSFDLLGCGASGRAHTWERCTISEYGADLTALCDVLNIDRPVVLGHSLGAATTLSAALANPGRFAGLVLLAPASTTGLDFLPDEASFAALAHPNGEQQRALARAAFRRPRLMTISESSWRRSAWRRQSTSREQRARCGRSLASRS
jgi:sigma-B regulation protein RsbQ